MCMHLYCRNHKVRDGEGIVTNYTASPYYFAFNTDAQFSFDPKMESLLSRFVDPNPTVHYSGYWSYTSSNLISNLHATSILEPNYFFANDFSLEQGKLHGMMIRSFQDGSLGKYVDSANGFQFSTKQNQPVTPTPEPRAIAIQLSKCHSAAFLSPTQYQSWRKSSFM